MQETHVVGRSAGYASEDIENEQAGRAGGLEHQAKSEMLGFVISPRSDSGLLPLYTSTVHKQQVL